MFYLNCITGSKIYREEIEIKVVAIPHSDIVKFMVLTPLLKTLIKHNLLQRGQNCDFSFLSYSYSFKPVIPN